MTAVLNKTFVVQFYRINAGFFLVLFIVLFGLLSGWETIRLHYGIMQGITSSMAYMAAATLVWVAYGFKCVAFCIRTINNPSSSFVFTMQALTDRQQFRAWAWVASMLLMPVLVYGCIAVLVGIVNGNVLISMLFVIVQLVLPALLAKMCMRQVNGTWSGPAVILPNFNIGQKHFLFVLLNYSLSEKKMTFILLKVLSLLLLHALMSVFGALCLDREGIAFIIMFIASSHALLALYYVRFMEERMAFLRNLPLPLIRLFSLYLFTYGIIFLPELCFLLLNGYISLLLQLFVSLYLVSVSQLYLYTSLQYLPGMTTDRYTGTVLVFFFMSLLFLASFNLWLLFAVEMLAATAIFWRNYYRFELKTQ